MNLQAYLNRIQFQKAIAPNLLVLKQLQKSHLLNVPFENLDIHYGNKIVLDTAKIYDKVVNRNRGGFCYELNGLFFELLLQLKYQVHRIAAQVYDKEKGYGKEFDHLAIIVTIDGTEYLTDVGFGEFCLEPLKLEFGLFQKDPRGIFVMDRFKDNIRVNKIEDGKSTPQYIFKNIPRQYLEYEEMCHYHQTDPNSHFTKKRMISLATKKGRITISGESIKIKEGNAVQKILINSEIEFHQFLKKYFSIEEFGKN